MGRGLVLEFGRWDVNSSPLFNNFVTLGNSHNLTSQFSHLYSEGMIKVPPSEECCEDQANGYKRYVKYMT